VDCFASWTDDMLGWGVPMSMVNRRYNTMHTEQQQLECGFYLSLYSFVMSGVLAKCIVPTLPTRPS
jgi:hypothetical protein